MTIETFGSQNCTNISCEQNFSRARSNWLNTLSWSVIVLIGSKQRYLFQNLNWVCDTSAVEVNSALFFYQINGEKIADVIVEDRLSF